MIVSLQCTAVKTNHAMQNVNYNFLDDEVSMIYIIIKMQCNLNNGVKQ